MSTVQCIDGCGTVLSEPSIDLSDKRVTREDMARAVRCKACQESRDCRVNGPFRMGAVFLPELRAVENPRPYLAGELAPVFVVTDE